MKSFQQFLSESINIAGDFNGTMIVGADQPTQHVGENFVADVVWEGRLYRMELTINGDLPSNRELTEELQDEYPGAIVQNVYPVEERPTRSISVTKAKRYHPAKLDWIED